MTHWAQARGMVLLRVLAGFMASIIVWGVIWTVSIGMAPIPVTTGGLGLAVVVVWAGLLEDKRNRFRFGVRRWLACGAGTFVIFSVFVVSIGAINSSAEVPATPQGVFVEWARWAAEFFVLHLAFVVFMRLLSGAFAPSGLVAAAVGTAACSVFLLTYATGLFAWAISAFSVCVLTLNWAEHWRRMQSNCR